jgi:hypothetical protein
VREILASDFIKGKIIEFGEYKWRILDVKDKKALIITDEIIGKSRLDDKSSIWASSEIRKYLNGDFYNKFTNQDKSKIIIQNNRTKKISKKECSTDVCEYTDDHIFCLSYEEVYIYFSNCTKKIEKFKKVAKRDKYNMYIEDENSILRQ